MSVRICSKFKLSSFLRGTSNFQRRVYLLESRSCSSGVPMKIKLEDNFFDKRVQSILKRITGFNYDKVFRKRSNKIVPDQFMFATEEKLKEMLEEANAKAEAKLQMPPVMDIREPIDEVLSKDPILQYYNDTRLLFIDTSPSRTDRNRPITARETDGTLRKATWEERFKMNQIFFPLEGRSLETPPMFESPYLDKLLEEGSYEFVLDAACAQFEPDDPEYHRVTNATYEHLKNQKMFDALRCTRHFGPMAFYFARNKNINPLLVDMMEKQLITDAAETIKLLYILHPDLNVTTEEMGDLEVIKDYVERNKSPQTADLELAFQTLLEVQSKTEMKDASSL